MYAVLDSCSEQFYGGVRKHFAHAQTVYTGPSPFFWEGPGYEASVVPSRSCWARVASVPGLPRYAFTLRFNFAGEGTFEIGAQTSREVQVTGRRLEVWHFCVCVRMLRAVTQISLVEKTTAALCVS